MGTIVKKVIILAVSIISFNCSAAGIVMQCGGFRLDAIPNQMTKVNGETVTSQKNIFLGDNGIKVEMTLMPARDGNMYGFEYIHPDGSKRHWLNVELIRTNMEQPRIIGSFDCKRIKN